MDKWSNAQKIKIIELAEKNKKFASLEYEKCRRDFYYWLINWVYTLDPHAHLQGKNPIRQFPDKDYFKEFTKVLMTHDKILVPKSRQIMISWIMCAYTLWHSQFNVGRFAMVQSKKEGDANRLLDRIFVMWQNQPAFLKEPNIAKQIENEISFKQKMSYIIALAQGSDQARMNTASLIFIDEGAFIPALRDVLTAAKPTTDGGAQIVIVSTANPGYFCSLVHDEKVSE